MVLNGTITAGNAIVATSSGTVDGDNFAEAKKTKFGLGSNADANDDQRQGHFH